MLHKLEEIREEFAKHLSEDELFDLFGQPTSTEDDDEIQDLIDKELG